ncbi:MAG: restriction endonuclease subunit S [Hyphomicrobiaceae bacterium]
MNVERLLQHYEKIADATDAIARLRRFVLDLAVRGKLVPQDPKDEPASDVGLKIKTRSRGQVQESIEPPFGVPAGWAWRAVDTLADQVTDGEHATPPRISEAQVPLVTAKNVREGFMDYSQTDWVSYETARKAWGRCRPQVGDLLMVCVGATTGRLTVLREARDMVLVRSVALVRPNSDVLNEYLERAIRSPFVQQQIWASIKAAAQPCLYINRIQSLLIPLPPLAEQHRIVAKVDELMGLCDRLEAARAAREAARDRLALASLARLNAPDPETFQADARFALNALPALTTRPDQIKRLRQTILNLAVRGKLLPQDANDEPASELLKRIAKEKARLVKEGKAKRYDALPEIDLDQAPFELPDGWAWGRFPEVGTFARGKSKHRPRNDPVLFDGGEHLMIQTGDVARSQGVIETYTSKYNDFGLSQSFKWPKGTLCITIAANIADSGILSFDACFPDSVVGFIPASMFENARYFEYFVRTAKANLLEFAPATAQKNINLEILTQVLIPLPPLAEQHRIVAKVDELMALCDRLEGSLTATAATRRRLLDALLAEALAPVDVAEMEAAE